MNQLIVSGNITPLVKTDSIIRNQPHKEKPHCDNPRNIKVSDFKIQFNKFDILIMELTEEIRRLNRKINRTNEIGQITHVRINDNIARLQTRISDLEKCKDCSDKICKTSD